MADVPNTSELPAIWSARSGLYTDVHTLMDELVACYHGTLPSEFNDFFHPEMHIHLVNMIRLAWDDLAHMAGKEFPLYVPPRGRGRNTATAKERAERLEKVCYAYNEAGLVRGGIHMKFLMKILAWWLVGCSDAVAMALPDYDLHTPYFTFRDPRTHYPPPGWTPWSQAPLTDTMFAYEMAVGELKDRYPEAKTRLTPARTFGPGSAGGKADEDTNVIWVGEHYQAEGWVVATLNDENVELLRSEEGDNGHPGVMPVVPFTTYSPESPKGWSMFADQMSIQAAMARMFSQKLDYFDRVLYPLIFTTPLSHQNIRIGPYAINEWQQEAGAPPPRVDTVRPESSIDADRMIEFSMGMSRMLNRNPESFQGGGQADSSKAIESLQAGVTSTIRDGFWPSFITGLPRLYAAAMRMDVKLWPNERKDAQGTMGNAFYTVSYRPRLDLEGHEDAVRVEPGIGLAGYQGTLEIMQLVGADLMSEDDAFEQMDGVREPQEWKRRLQASRIEKLIFADFEAKAQQGILMPGALAELRRRVEAGDKDLFDAITEMEKAGQLVQPPPEAAGPGGPGGLPPELAALAGGLPGLPAPPLAPGEGPAASSLPLPTLSALRGGPGPIRTGRR